MENELSGYIKTFRCFNCGKTIDKQIIYTIEDINNVLNILNKSKCCKKPYYWMK